MSYTTRQKEILDILKHRGFVSTEELVEIFSITPQTIRRDLNYLAANKKIIRSHGGAIQFSGIHDTSYAERKIANLKGKQQIAKRIAENIPDGSSIFIDGGTTNEEIAKELNKKKNLYVISNSMNVANILMKNKNLNVVIAGGEIRSADGAILGSATRDFIKQYKTDYAIIGVGGIDEMGDMTGFDHESVNLAKTMIECAKLSFIVADHSKFGRKAMIAIGNIKDIDKIFTDLPIEKPFIDIINKYQIEYSL